MNLSIFSYSYRLLIPTQTAYRSFSLYFRFKSVVSHSTAPYNIFSWTGLYSPHSSVQALLSSKVLIILHFWSLLANPVQTSIKPWSERQNLGH